MNMYHVYTPSNKPRARGLGIPFQGQPGPYNSITDVPGVEVGYTTLIRGNNVRTGVTAIFPRGRDGVGDPVVSGVHVQNGNGEMTGVSWIFESGTFSGPIILTNTHAVGVAHAAVIRWTVDRFPHLTRAWLLPVVAETWDGYLNDINGRHITESDVIAALEAARNGPVDEGSVGGGTGMNCYEFKGGSGTASRKVRILQESYTVGVFVQANFGRREELTILGVPVGKELHKDNPIADYFRGINGAGSVIAVVATDAPLLPDQCRALARRVTLGLARTGTSGSHFSGDIFIAFSTANSGAFASGAKALFTSESLDFGILRFVPWALMDVLYEAVVQATEEAVINALTANDDMVGFCNRRSPALPRDEVVQMLRERGVIQAGDHY